MNKDGCISTKSSECSLLSTGMVYYFFTYAFVYQICIKHCCVVLGARDTIRRKMNSISAVMEITDCWRKTD